MILKSILIILCITFLGITLWAEPKSKEAVEFVENGKRPLSDSLKSAAYIGSYRRLDEPQQDLKIVDLYEFKSISATKMTRSLCDQLLGRIFGRPEDSGLTLKSLALKTTPRGLICEVQLNDDADIHAKIPERRIVIGFVNLKAHAIVFRLLQKSDANSQENILKFWRSLR